MAEPQLDVLLLSASLQVRGSCATTLRLLARLPGRQIGAQLVTSDASLLRPKERTKLRMHEVPQLEMPLLRWLAARSLIRELQARPPDVIHIQSRRMLRMGQYLARAWKRPCVLTIHDYLRPREVLPIDTKITHGIITVSESVRRDLIERTHLPDDLIRVVPSGVEGNHSMDDPILDPKRVAVVGTACPLESIKGLPYFLNAAKRVLASGRDVEFLVAGAGPEEANLRRLARTLGVAHKVTFVPYVLDFTDSLEAMDIFCLPSLQQGLGTVMLQAMAMGRPVIATGVGGVNTIVKNGETGLTVAPSNSVELAARIIELLDDPVRARLIGNNAQILVERDFNVENMVDRMVEIYRDVHERAKAAPPRLVGAV